MSEHDALEQIARGSHYDCAGAWGEACDNPECPVSIARKALAWPEDERPLPPEYLARPDVQAKIKEARTRIDQRNRT